MRRCGIEVAGSRVGTITATQQAQADSDMTFYDTATERDAGSRSDLTDITGRTAANEHEQVRLYKKKAGVTTLIQDSIYCPLNVPFVYTHAF